MNYNIKEALGYISKNRGEVIDKMVSFATTDTLLFWSANKKLKDLQSAVWEPYLRWFYEQTSALFTYGESLDVPQENIDTSYRLKPYLESFSNTELCAAYLCGFEVRSIILGVAFAKHFALSEDVMKAAFLERDFQINAWGSDDIEQQKFDEIAANLKHLQNFIAA